MSMKNMIAMFGAMAILRRVDQEEPIVLVYARMGYAGYVLLTFLVYSILHFRIKSRRDRTVITVPISKKGPSFSEALAQAKEAADKAEAEAKRKAEGITDDQSETTSVQTTEDKPDASAADKEPAKEEMEEITVLEYDLRHLASARQSWVTSACLLALIHYFTQSVSPLIMSSVTGIFRLLTDDPLVQIHIRGAPTVGKLARPFVAEKSPLAGLLKDMAPPEPSAPTAATSRPRSAEPEDVHDDGDDDDDDDGPVKLSELKDENIKSDFDDDEHSVETKKDQ